MNANKPMLIGLVLLGLVVMSIDVPGMQSSKPLPAKSAAMSPATFAPEALDRLLAPIALYPDQLLAQVLLCATDPAGLSKLDAWLKTNPPFKGTALEEAARQSGFEPSFVALSLFPQVVDFMVKESSWATELGRAFSADRGAVVASVQRLRAKSRENGTLKSTPQQTVTTITTESGQQAIVIEPANPQVIYVPQYSPQVVYAPTSASSTVVTQQNSNDDDEAAAVAAGVVGFAAGVAIGAAMDNDYYYGPYGWHGAPRMYNDAWDDYYDDRQDAREDYYDNRSDAREDYYDNREDVANQRSETGAQRQQTRQENQPQTQAAREQRRGTAQEAAQQPRSTSTSTYESRGNRDRSQTSSVDRSGTTSDAFSGYSSGKSERSASSRGQRSRSSSGGGGRGGGRRR